MFNEITSSPYYAPVLMLSLYGALTLAGIYWYFRVFKKKITVTMSKTRLTTIPEKLIEAIRIKEEDELTDIPKHLQKMIRKPTDGIILERMFFIHNGEKDSQMVLDLRRITTLMASITKVAIPLEMILLDSRTKALYALVKEQLELVHVNYNLNYPIVAQRYMVENNDLNMWSNYETGMLTVGLFVLSYSNSLSYPCIDIFCDNVRSTFATKRPESERLSDQDIRSMVTAFSAIAKIKIPKSYVNEDAMAIVLMTPKHVLLPIEEKTKEQPKLRVVQNVG